ncbi:MAG: CoA-binding protein, partial [Actinomycetota bacterium]|nr:CoA-binding protein [Actinomycetota bacterium]
MTQATSLSRVFNPRSVAFYGASNNPMTMGTAQLATLMAQGYQGKIYPIHPKEEKVLGRPAYKTISELPEIPDLTVMVLPTKIVLGILEECGRAGVKAVIVVSGGFREIGESGVNLERELVQIARKYDITLIGPNCIGITNFNIGLNTTYFHNPGKSGGITIISQSGTYSCQVYDYLKDLGANLSHTVSVGNSAITDMSDFLYYFADEPTTKSIALYIEGISNGEKFIRAARYASERKPVVALYVGGTPAGARAGLSHTGALAGKDSVYEGVFKQTGIIRTDNFEELLDLAWALALLPPAKGRKICVLTNSGGPGASMADSCARAGLEVPLLSDELQSKIHRVLPST